MERSLSRSFGEPEEVMHPTTKDISDSVTAASSSLSHQHHQQQQLSSGSDMKSMSPETAVGGRGGDGSVDKQADDDSKIGAGGGGGGSISLSNRETQKANAYHATRELLDDDRKEAPAPISGEFLGPFTSIVSLRNAVTDPSVLGSAWRSGGAPVDSSSRTASSSAAMMRPPLLGLRGNGRGNMNDSGGGGGSGTDGGDDEIVDYVEDLIQQHQQQVRPLPARAGGMRGGVLRHPGIGHHLNHHLNVQLNSNNINTMAMSIPSLLTPNRGHHALFRALEDFESLEKQELTIQLQTDLTKSLTEIVTEKDTYASSKDAIGDLEALSQSVPRRVCQHPFKKNDIVWVCRTCQADETCVLCHSCFKDSKHEGHDVAFYHAQAGGCVRFVLSFYLCLFESRVLHTVMSLCHHSTKIHRSDCTISDFSCLFSILPSFGRFWFRRFLLVSCPPYFSPITF